tara:strand:- start:510 stop:683 length:174 start_codon:yes stop_codon:yes gene_type:complete
MNKDKLITRIEEEIKASKNRLDAHTQEQIIESIAFEKGYINALATLKFDIKYDDSLE